MTQKEQQLLREVYYRLSDYVSVFMDYVKNIMDFVLVVLWAIVTVFIALPIMILIRLILGKEPKFTTYE